jgi:hypothetical protein
LVGNTAPSCANTDSSALRSCTRVLSYVWVQQGGGSSRRGEQWRIEVRQVGWSELKKTKKGCQGMAPAGGVFANISRHGFENNKQLSNMQGCAWCARCEPRTAYPSTAYITSMYAPLRLHS